MTPHSSQKRVSITLPADGCVQNIFGFGEGVWHHSFLAFLVSSWWQWAQISSPVTILPRKPSPSASKCFKFPGRHQHVVLSFLQSAGVAPTLQTLTELQNIMDDMVCWSWLISRRAAISCTVTRQFSFTMASTAAMASGVTTRCAWSGRGESITEQTPFRNFLLHLYTCCSDRHASPYWTSIHQWISMGFTPSPRTKRMTECCSSWVHVASGAAIFTLVLRRRVAFLHRTATCWPLFKLWVSLLPTYRTI